MKIMNPLIIILFVFISCNLFNKEVEFEQLNGNKKITISSDFRGDYKDSVKLNIPLKFKVSNIINFNFLIVNYNYNGKRLIDVTEYNIFEEDYNTLFPLPLKPKQNNLLEKTFYINNSNIKLSNQKAKEIASKYNIEFNKWGEKFRDTIQLTNYSQFKKDFPEIFDELNAVGDSLVITTREGNSKIYNSKIFPINW